MFLEENKKKINIKPLCRVLEKLLKYDIRIDTLILTNIIVTFQWLKL